MRPGAKKSVVWNFFQKSENGKSRTCTLCKKIIQCHGGTSNLKQHLLRIHPIQMSQIQNVPFTDDIENENAGNITDISLFAGASTNLAATLPIEVSFPPKPVRLDGTVLVAERMNFRCRKLWKLMQNY